jgi:hypothetical protein
MNFPLASIAVLTTAAGLAAWRSWRSDAPSVLAWLQLPTAALLYFAVFPPAISLRGDALSVITPDAPQAARAAPPSGQPVVALRGASAPALAEPTPDLATALRRHPAVDRLSIIGGGIGARDRPAAARLGLSFEASPPWGLLDLEAPATAPLGTLWQLAGRAAPPVRRAELRDPAGAIIDTGAVDAAGRFRVSAPARGLGQVNFELRLLGERDTLIDAITVPLIVEAGSTLRVIVRYGAINPELKYWRRWAEDAGIDLSLSAALTDGVHMLSGDAALTAAALQQADLVIVDSRAWATLTAAERAALLAAVDQGLGLLLRADALPDLQTAAQWKDLGYAVTAAAAPSGITLDGLTGLRDRTTFSVSPIAVAAGTSAVQFAADDGQAVAWWHSEGRGRIGLWRLLDSYRLVLLGEPARYASLWANTLGRLARAQVPPPSQPQLPRTAWVDQRAVACGLGAAATMVAPNDAAAVRLVVDRGGCAAFWPQAPGWHRLETAAMSWPFYVHAADDGRSLRFALDARATADLEAPEPVAAPGAAAHAAGAPPPLREPMSRWPWFLAWLALIARIWWGEREPVRRDATGVVRAH